MTVVPRRLLVLGAGPAGVELAQVTRSFGAEVVMVEGADRVLAREPAPLGEGLGEALRRDGIELELGARATAARRDGEDFVLELSDGRELRGDRLLVATGRRPRVAGIGLETVGIEEDPHGIPGRRAPERRRAAVGDRRRDRHLAAHARRRVPGRGRRLQHPRRGARGELRGGAARDLHQPSGRVGGCDRGTVRAGPLRWPRWPRPPPTPTPTPSRAAFSRSSATVSGSPGPTRSDLRPASGSSRPRWPSVRACRLTSCATRSSPSRASRRSSPRRSRRSASEILAAGAPAEVTP